MGAKATEVDMAEEIRRAQLIAAANLQKNAPQPPPDMRPGDWLCAVCATHNYSTRSTCFRCHHGSNPGRHNPTLTAAQASLALTTQGPQAAAAQLNSVGKPSAY